MAASPVPVEFNSSGTICRGLFLKPETREFTTERGAPCVVMAHGFGGTIDAGLEPFAERFAAAGFSALMFDYRGFGGSDGRPRQLLSIAGQLDDYTAAAAFARTLPGVDPSRLVFWGSSFSGGHVIEAAGRDGSAAAVISQCPMMDGYAALKNLLRYAGPGLALRLTWLGLKDLFCEFFARPPVMLPIIGPPGSTAVMTAEDAEPGFRRIVPSDWKNEVCARIGLFVGVYRPGLKADRLPCPTLVLVCENDSVAPVEAVEAAARAAGDRAVVRRYPIGHFDIYVGEDFERSVADQIDFLSNVLASASDFISEAV